MSALEELSIFLDPFSVVPDQESSYDMLFKNGLPAEVMHIIIMDGWLNMMQTSKYLAALAIETAISSPNLSIERTLLVIVRTSTLLRSIESNPLAVEVSTKETILKLSLEVALWAFNMFGVLGPKPSLVDLKGRGSRISAYFEYYHLWKRLNKMARNGVKFNQPSQIIYDHFTKIEVAPTPAQNGECKWFREPNDPNRMFIINANSLGNYILSRAAEFGETQHMFRWGIERNTIFRTLSYHPAFETKEIISLLHTQVLDINQSAIMCCNPIRTRECMGFYLKASNLPLDRLVEAMHKELENSICFSNRWKLETYKIIFSYNFIPYTMAKYIYDAIWMLVHDSLMITTKVSGIYSNALLDYREGEKKTQLASNQYRVRQCFDDTDDILWFLYGFSEAGWNARLPEFYTNVMVDLFQRHRDVVVKFLPKMLEKVKYEEQTKNAIKIQQVPGEEVKWLHASECKAYLVDRDVYVFFFLALRFDHEDALRELILLTNFTDEFVRQKVEKFLFLQAGWCGSKNCMKHLFRNSKAVREMVHRAIKSEEEILLVQPTLTPETFKRLIISPDQTVKDIFYKEETPLPRKETVEHWEAIGQLFDTFYITHEVVEEVTKKKGWIKNFSSEPKFVVFVNAAANSINELLTNRIFEEVLKHQRSHLDYAVQKLNLTDYMKDKYVNCIKERKIYAIPSSIDTLASRIDIDVLLETAYKALKNNHYQFYSFASAAHEKVGDTKEWKNLITKALTYILGLKGEDAKPWISSIERVFNTCKVNKFDERKNYFVSLDRNLVVNASHITMIEIRRKLKVDLSNIRFEQPRQEKVSNKETILIEDEYPTHEDIEAVVREIFE